MRIATIAENEAKLEPVMLIEEKVFAVGIAMNWLMLGLVLSNTGTRLGLIVVFAVSEFLVKMGILQKISKVEKIKKLAVRMEALTPFIARKLALKREGIKVVRVVDLSTVI